MVLGIDSPCNGSCLAVDAQDHGGVLGQQTENQKMRMASTTKSVETIRGHAHFLVLSSMAIRKNAKTTNNNNHNRSLIVANCAPRC